MQPPNQPGQNTGAPVSQVVGAPMGGASDRTHGRAGDRTHGRASDLCPFQTESQFQAHFLHGVGWGAFTLFHRDDAQLQFEQF